MRFLIQDSACFPTNYILFRPSHQSTLCEYPQSLWCYLYPPAGRPVSLVIGPPQRTEPQQRRAKCWITSSSITPLSSSLPDSGDAQQRARGERACPCQSRTPVSYRASQQDSVCEPREVVSDCLDWMLSFSILSWMLSSANLQGEMPEESIPC